LHDQYPFVLSSGIIVTITKEYSAVLLLDAIDRNASRQVTEKQKKSETIADWQ